MAQGFTKPPLPSGASTSALQSTGNTSVASIDAKLPALGQALAAASVPVVLTAAQVSALTPPAAITGFATAAKQPALGTAGTASADVITVQGIASGVAVAVSLSSVPSHAVTNAGTFAVQAAITAASGSIASGAVAAGAFASGSMVDGSNVTLGSKADAKSTATDTTSVSVMSVLKQISASVQAPPSQAVTNAGTFAVQSTLSAGSALIGQASASNETSTVYNGTTALTPKFAVIAASTSGNNTIVPAVTSKKIRVLAVNLVASGTVNSKWQSGASGTDLTGLAYLVANTGMVLPYSPVGWFETASNTLLNLNLSGAQAVGGSITYVEV